MIYIYMILISIVFCLSFFFFLPFSCCCFFCCCRRKFDGFVAALCTRPVFVLQGSGSQRDDVVILSHSFQVRWTRLWSTILFRSIVEASLEKEDPIRTKCSKNHIISPPSSSSSSSSSSSPSSSSPAAAAAVSAAAVGVP